MYVSPEDVKYSFFVGKDADLSEELSNILIKKGFIWANGDKLPSRDIWVLLVCKSNKMCIYEHFGSHEELYDSKFGGDRVISAKEFIRQYEFNKNPKKRAWADELLWNVKKEEKENSEN